MLARVDLFDRPAGVFCDQWFGIVRGFFESGQGIRVADVPEGDANVAQDAAALGAQEWCAREFCFELGIVQREQFHEIGLIQVGAEMVFEQIRLSGESIPRARGEAIVAAVNAIANGGAKLERNGTLEFDREIRNATAGIELERRGDGGGRAG